MRWSDEREKKRLENRLNDFVIKIYREIFKRKEWDFKREQKRKEEEAKAYKAEESRKQQELERQKIQLLEKNAADWEKSKLVKAFIEAKKVLHIKENSSVEPDSEFAQWLAWAHQHADRLDSLKENVLLSKSLKFGHIPIQIWTV